MANKESILIRVGKEVKEKIERIAKKNLRSVNKEIEKMIIDREEE